MNPFPWSDKFLTGQKEVDDQHFYLVTLINQFIALITENKVSLKEVSEIYAALEEYSVYHFQEEEQLMRDAGIDADFLDDHIKAHQMFLAEIKRMYQNITADNFDDCHRLSDFLVHWLIVHILIVDKSMGRQIEKIESGVSSKEAFKSEKKSNDSATEILVNALNHLFSEVAQRNLALESLNQSLENKVSERTIELQKMNDDLKHLSITDQLTNLPNRRFAISHLQALWTEADTEYAELSEKPLSCLMIDVDNFKIVNDSFGHDAGDKVLIELTKKLQQTLRNDDIICRLGGDEFFVICENTDLAGAQYAAQLLSTAVKELVVTVGDGQWFGSISIGVATKLASMQHLDELIKMADQGVYLAKQAGKSCVKTF
ncbi:GGDEF domain-containing protein [Psychromonas marina]|uniref:diguanylate cyclase n=1 Tax=Psychromonas marina TaxID=88364 RepID=A0ABQ6DXY9_9GAMM|nr:GGDEF domain-containing protein [Psychromonas marina]GLS89859.1 GGDEF domain-containing protein [Psychromonas marina]